MNGWGNFMPETDFAKLQRKTLVRGIVIWTVLFVGLFLLAGRLDYWRLWLYIGLTVATTVEGMLVMKPREDLQKERLQPGGEIQPWDKLYFALSVPLWVVSMALCVLDSGRFHFSPVLDPLWSIPGAVLFLAGHIGFSWSKAANSFFSSIVRIQTDRGQTVCENGPYRIVRHPGYLFSLGYMLGGPLVLGSFWGLVPQLIASALLVWRTAKEDRFLRNGLAGYEDYTRRVKHRLFPGIW